MSAPIDIHDAYSSLDDYCKELEAKLAIAKEALEKVVDLDPSVDYMGKNAYRAARDALEKLK